MRRWCVLGLAAAACSPASEVQTWSNGDGFACLSGAGSYTVVVDFDEYVQCAAEDAFTCAVQLDGDRIVVTASGRVDTSTCPPAATIASAVASCAPIDLPDGAYTLVYGDAEVAVELPLDAEVCTRG